MDIPASDKTVPLRITEDQERHFHHSLDLLCVAGLDGHFRHVNPSWTRVLGWSREELLARPVVEFMHPDDRERTLLARANLAKGIPVRELENRYLCKDGSFRWLSWQSSLEPSDATVFAVARDVTERRQRENEQLILSKLQSTGILAGGIAHDFNNLLTGIMLNLEMLRLTGEMTPQQQKHVQQALDTAHAAHVITDKLLTFSSGGEAARKTIDLKKLLQQSLDLALGGSNSRGDSEFAPDLWPAEIDEDQIAQVIRNLVLNAREAMPGGGVVTIRAQNLAHDGNRGIDLPQGNYVWISISDQGPGISPEILGRIFDPYFSTKARGVEKGMGLGLTICHSVIQKHGGRITVNSQVGLGTTIHCYLRAAPVTVLVPSPSQEFAPSSLYKILIMDDEEGIREVLGQALAQFGHTVEAAKDGLEAITLFHAAAGLGSPFDVVLLDLTVKGGMGGADTLKFLRERTPAIKSILITGYNQEETFREYAGHGFSAALSKPFQIERLRSVLAGVLTPERV